ncbi:phosphopantetheine-binding protein [Plantactinospora sp. KBS50]|uniref:phosphopantetheine-binding protein n=1 Tax=Plantactinospora sp. KBS50 TaxID=2024580 RepID=UPI000BAAFFC1|nr:phosphopantetheine-binding protein [Plantactinospora sp. KBS50]ASW54619.1 hypothetical protein CIK06_11155 [Plantactinospora sp. KBS50]
MMTPWDARFAELLHDVLPKLPEMTGDTCLRSHGLDSLATVELLLLLEETYEVSVPDQLLTTENFSTPAALWAMIEQVRGGPVPAGSAAGQPGPVEPTAGGR